MVQEEIANRSPHYLWPSMIASVLLPMLLGFILSHYIPEWRWNHYPFHSMVESVGSLSALTIATLMIVMVNNKNLPRYYIWVSCALISMGILDGFHAILHAGVSFVWLHSIATISGGLVFAAIWIPQKLLTDKFQKNLIINITIASILTSALSLIYPELLPAMIVKGNFTTLAKVLNITGGLGFLFGCAFFVYHHYKNSNETDQQQREDFVFANHCLLFGIAGLLFESSVIWDAGWWWWHVLRLIAYLVVLIYFFSLFKQQQDILQKNKVELSKANENLEQRVYERTQQLEKASQAKSNFLSSMSHELRTPLNAVLGFSQLLQLNNDLNEKQNISNNEILKAGHHLLDLINKVLDLSTIENGKIEMDTSDVNISKTISDVIAILKPLTIKQNITITNNFSSQDNYILVLDELRFKQVVINLLSNAIKYNKENGHVAVDIEVTDNKIRISFTDTGVGVSKEKQRHLFKPFERLGHENGTIEGAGIGLVLCKNLVELMNGEIGINNITEEGSSFYIEFPYES